MGSTSQGDPEAAARRLGAIENIPELDVTEEVRQLGRALVSGGPIPKGSEIGSVRKTIRRAENPKAFEIPFSVSHRASRVYIAPVWLCEYI